MGDYLAAKSGFADDQHRIAELMAQIPADLRMAGGGEQGLFRREGRQQGKVARAPLVETGQQAVHDPQRILRVDSQVGDRCLGLDSPAMRGGRSFERAHHARSDGDHTPAFAAGLFDRLECGLGNLETLGQRKERIHDCIPDRRQTGGVREGRQGHALSSQRAQQFPVERQPRRRRLDSPGPRPVCGLDVPQRQRSLQMRVLDGPAMTVERLPEGISFPVEGQIHQARRDRPDPADRRGEIAVETQKVSGSQARRRRTLFGASPPVSATQKRRRPLTAVWSTPGQAHLDVLA